MYYFSSELLKSALIYVCVWTTDSDPCVHVAHRPSSFLCSCFFERSSFQAGCPILGSRGELWPVTGQVGELQEEEKQERQEKQEEEEKEGGEAGGVGGAGGGGGGGGGEETEGGGEGEAEGGQEIG